MQSALLWFLGACFLAVAPMVVKAGTNRPSRGAMWLLILVGALCVRLA